MRPNTLDVIPKRKQITMFKVGKHWVLKYFFDNKEIFQELADNYDEHNYRFVFKTFGERNKALKLLERRGFDVDLVEDLKGYVVKLSRYAKYASVLKNSVVHIESPEWRVFLMKDKAAVEEAVRMGAKVVEVEVRF